MVSEQSSQKRPSPETVFDLQRMMLQGKYWILSQLKTSTELGSTVSFSHSLAAIELSTLIGVRVGTACVSWINPVTLVAPASGWSTSKTCESPFNNNTGLNFKSKD